MTARSHTRTRNAEVRRQRVRAIKYHERHAAPVEPELPWWRRYDPVSRYALRDDMADAVERAHRERR